ncbi:MAG: 5,10-methylenetetrahydromethanopterin reductase [Roseiflexaceae bacterium]
MRFSIRFNNDLPATAYPVLAQAAEAAGFDQFWVSDDLFLRGVWPILTACALATQRIELGTCIVNPYTCHPSEIAMQAAALDEISNGRCNLGIAAGAGDFLGWVGLSQDRPLATTADAIRALRALFAGERPATLTPPPLGWSEAAYLRFSTRQIPIYLGAMSPKMQHMIGALADGGLPLLFPPEQYHEVAERVRAGAQAAGRDPATIDLAACIWVSLADDRASAEAPLREKVAYYGHAFSADVLARLGLSHADFAEIEQAVQVENNLTRACGLVTPQMLRVGIAGLPADLIPRLEGLVAAGARHLSFGPPLGPDPATAIALLGKHVLPYFRA